MSKFDKIKPLKSEDFLRLVGINLNDFELILQKVSDYIKADKEKHPCKKRGLKLKLCLEDKLLLTIYYIRNYSTFLKLGEDFEIGESYANKIYHKTSNILLKVLKLKGCNDLLSSNLGQVIIDVSEQPIERPQKKQKSYYSGKKTTYYKSTNSNRL